jgi:hypothetical protein
VPTLERLTSRDLRDAVRTFRDTVHAHAGTLNRLNVYPVPDGDTGTNMARTLDAVVVEMDAVDADDLDATCGAIRHGSLMGARGNSGVILSQILRGIASTTEGADTIDAATYAAALAAASDGAYQAVLRPIEGTILTVVRASAEGAATSAAAGDDLAAVVRAGRVAAAAALESTPDLLPVLREAGVVDAGGAGYVLLMHAVAHVVCGDPLPEVDDTAAADLGALGVGTSPDVADRGGVAGAGEIDVSEQRYEVMYFLELADDRIDRFKNGWGAIGDSIVVVGGDGLWNCHVHTNDVGAAVEVALDLDGRPRQIRVTDLFDEVGEEHARREAAMHAGPADAVTDPTATTGPRAGAGLPPVTTAVVAVGSGDGLLELFSQLGVQGVVTGGQTMNPSTAELLDVVEHVNANDVVVLPNNKNIIPVAAQIDALTAKTVRVVETRSVPEGLAALIVYDPEASSDENHVSMSAAASSVTTGEITRAVRDTTTPAGAVTAGQWIGLVRGDGVVAVSDSAEGAALMLLDEIVGDDAELLTVITGNDAAGPTTETLVGWMHDHHPDVTIEVHVGGQPLYPYVFGVE